MRALCCQISLILFWLLTPATASAHLLPAQNATINLVGTSAYLVVSIPVSALTGVDRDGDGRLNAAELQSGMGAIGAQFSERSRVNQGGNPGRSLFAWVMNPYTDGFPTRGLDYIVVIQRVEFAEPATTPTLHTDLFGTAPGTGQMTITATRGAMREVAILDPLRPAHRFFRGGWAILGDFVLTGAEHILLGPDHLLFLLTVIVAGTGWRYWLGVITSFTAAHSITLTLSALDIVSLSPSIVEPAIAASIVAVAVLNLLARRPYGRTQYAMPRYLRERITLVFACGLLHGLGFASALADLGLDQQHRIASLAGFNLGVELGQFIFLACTLAIGALIYRFAARRTANRLSQLASLVAATLGLALFFSRI